MSLRCVLLLLLHLSPLHLHLHSLLVFVLELLFVLVSLQLRLRVRRGLPRRPTMRVVRVGQIGVERRPLAAGRHADWCACDDGD